MGESSESSAREREVRRYFWACVQIAGVTFAACVLGLVVILRSPWNATIPMLWAMACTACGSIIGFVLVAPRRGSIARQDAAIAHGSIDRLQDWILGLIVGVTLLQAREIPGTIEGLADSLARGVAGAAATDADLASARAFAVGLIVFFFAMGVIGGALVTRYLLAYLRDPRSEAREPADDVLVADAPEPTAARPAPDERPLPKIVGSDA